MLPEGLSATYPRRWINRTEPHATVCALKNFTVFYSQADAMLFETGRNRSLNLVVCAKLLGQEPRLVSLFLLEVAWVHARLQLSTAALPANFLHAATRFDTEKSRLLESNERQPQWKVLGSLISSPIRIHQFLEPSRTRLQRKPACSGQLPARSCFPVRGNRTISRKRCRRFSGTIADTMGRYATPHREIAHICNYSLRIDASHNLSPLD